MALWSWRKSIGGLSLKSRELKSAILVAFKEEAMLDVWLWLSLDLIIFIHTIR